MQLYDNFPIERSASLKIRRTADGYLTAYPRVARSGVQIYGGHEIGRSDIERVRVYRAPEEVFSPDSLQSYAHRPVTLNHPKVPVTAENWQDVARGHTDGEILRDGDFIRVPMVLMDARAIKAFENDTKELSLGYTCDVEFTPGVTADGVSYDAVQKNIRANHLALVSRARGGEKLRMGDEDTVTCGHCGKEVSATAKKCPHCGYSMKSSKNAGDSKGAIKMKTIVVDGVSIELEDGVSADVISRALASKGALETQITSLSDALKQEQTKVAEATTQSATKDATIATLQTQLKDAEMTPAKLDQMVRDRHEVIVKSRAVLGDALVIDSKSDKEMRRQVVDAKMGETAKGWNDDMVAASFAAITKDVKPETAAGSNGSSNFTDFARTFSQPGVGVDIRDKAYDDYDKDLTNAWKHGKTV